MKEADFLKIINDTLSDSHFLGDDCAYLEDLGIFVTQDTLVEDVHFSCETISPYQLGKKSIAVNLSDIAASLSTPKYVSISLSMPSSTSNDFVKEFYEGVEEICKKYDIKVIGGDITGSEKIFVSITAISKKTSQYLSSRSFAKENDLVVSTGVHGSSACALFALQNKLTISKNIEDSHLNPIPKVKEALQLSQSLINNIASMDTSDGLVDALYKIAEASKVSIEVDFDKIKIEHEIIEVAKKNNIDYEDWVLWGGEDYELIACIDEKTYNKLDKNIYKIIGKVSKQNNDFLVNIKRADNGLKITKSTFEQKSFNHFEEKL